MNMKALSAVVLALGVVCGSSTAAYAEDRTAVVTDAAPIYVMPDAACPDQGSRLGAIELVRRADTGGRRVTESCPRTPGDHCARASV